jgi:hypothetical protein
MFSINVDTIITKHVEDNIKQFYTELENEFRIALVNTREDFLNRVASILGSVPETGGTMPSPYVGVYKPLTKAWVHKKIKFGWMMPIGTATGETQNWLFNLAKNPEKIIQNGEFIEIDINIPKPTGGDDSSAEAKIYMMEFGIASKNIPARPIFRPAVVWYLTLGMTSPFYIEAILARNRAIQKVYGNV